ncbi:MAG TPA: cytochrome o ubiquinol oxidase subunit IV [Candidatus Saccharimonadales bacterium]|jgi:cytochrome o ubiquinol oxidase operon protein cyoD|nr:cytochrome o ubiquinol oxidase subunit IV [Candidatus Saccharimonadales bacterium]
MNQKPIVSHHDSAPGSVRSYSLGFGLSLLLTLVAYIFANSHKGSGWALIYVLAALAITQLFVQLVFFLHLGRESKPRWNLTVFAFAAMVVVILAFGSLWIMKNLNYGHQLPANETPQQIIQDEGYNPSSY